MEDSVVPDTYPADALADSAPSHLSPLGQTSRFANARGPTEEDLIESSSWEPASLKSPRNGDVQFDSLRAAARASSGSYHFFTALFQRPVSGSSPCIRAHSVIDTVQAYYDQFTTFEYENI